MLDSHCCLKVDKFFKITVASYSSCVSAYVRMCLKYMLLTKYMRYVGIFVDIDECRQNTHTCSQVCANDLGTYHCKCFSGYQRLARTPIDVTCTG